MYELLACLLLNCYYVILYVNSANCFPKPLTSDEERVCFIKMKDGDVEARNTLIERNLRLVAHIIKKYYSSHKDQEDLISIGTMGLIKAVNTFNPDKGTRLATYAARCIENEVLMFFRNAKKFGSEVYLCDPIDCDKEGNSLALMDILSCEDCIDDKVDQKIKIQKLYDYIGKVLTERENKIIALRYGLYSGRPHTQREVAKRLNISRSYVSRIEKKAIEKLNYEFIKKK